MVVAQALSVDPFNIQRRWTYAQLYLIYRCLLEQAEEQAKMVESARTGRAASQPMPISSQPADQYPKELRKSYWHGN